MATSAGLTSKRMSELALRKRMLQQRSTVLRHTLAIQLSATLTPALGLADRVVSSGQWLRRHPALLVGVAAVLLVWRPKAGISGLLHGAGRGMGLWQAWLKLQPMLMRLGQAAQTVHVPAQAAAHAMPVGQGASPGH